MCVGIVRVRVCECVNGCTCLWESVCVYVWVGTHACARVWVENYAGGGISVCVCVCMSCEVVGTHVRVYARVSMFL